MENFNIQEELKKLPGKPGVYLMHDEREQSSMSERQSALRTVSVSIFRAAGIKVPR